MCGDSLFFYCFVWIGECLSFLLFVFVKTHIWLFKLAFVQLFLFCCLQIYLATDTVLEAKLYDFDQTIFSFVLFICGIHLLKSMTNIIFETNLRYGYTFYSNCLPNMTIKHSSAKTQPNKNIESL